MKHEVVVIGIYYGTSKSGKSYRLLYLEDCDSTDNDYFEGRRCYTAFAPSDKPFVVGGTVEIIVHKGEAIVIA